jgi:general secretion pathway protein K
VIHYSPFTIHSSRGTTRDPRFIRLGGPACGGRFSNNKGMALVLTLLVVAILTALVVEFAYGVYVSTSALHNWQTSQKLSVAARSAVRLGSRLISENNSLHPSYTYPGLFEISQKIPFEDLDGTISIRIEDENAKFNINLLGGGLNPSSPDKDPYKSFVRLLNAIDLKADIADRISYWINSHTDHIPRGGKTATKNAAIDSVDELLLIPGIDKDSYERLRPYVTIYSNKLIDINSADIPALMSVSQSVKKEVAERIVRYRENTPFEKEADVSNVAGVDYMSLTGYITVTSSAYRVIATAESGGIKRIVECVLDSSGKIVNYWKEI